MTTQPALRPMTIGDLLDAAFRLYRANFVTFVGIVALLQVPMLIVQLLIQFTVYGSALTDVLAFNSRPPTLTPGANPLSALPIASLITIYVTSIALALIQSLVVYNLITGALAKAVATSYLGQPISILGAYRIGWRAFFSLMAASLMPYLATLLVIVPLFALLFGIVFASFGASSTGLPIWATILIILGLIVLGIGLLFVLAFVYVRFLLSPQSIVIESLGPLGSLGRSWRLTQRAFWRTLLLVILMGILVYIVSGIPASVISLVVQLTAPGNVQMVLAASAVAAIIGQIGLVLALPLQFSVYTLLYYDQRVRREAFDLELKAQQVAAV